MLLTRWWEGHWDGRQRTSRTTLTWGFLPASNQARPSAPLQCLESHGSDPTPHASSLFMLIRSIVPCLSAVFCFFAFFVAPTVIQRPTLSFHRTGPDSYFWFHLEAFLPAIPNHGMGPSKRDRDHSAQLSPSSTITIQLFLSGVISIRLFWYKGPEPCRP